jgi:uncharacterized membrane protein YkvA (DUF1232 family)
METATRTRTWAEALRHYLWSGKGRMVGLKLVVRVFPALYLPFGILNDAIPVIGWLDDIPISIYLIYLLIQVNKHRDPVKYP